MTDSIDNRLDTVVAAIDRAWEEGCPVAGHSDKFSLIALGAYSASQKRGENEGEIVSRMVRRLIDEFETDPKLVGPLRLDYEYLVGKIVAALQRHTVQD